MNSLKLKSLLAKKKWVKEKCVKYYKESAIVTPLIGCLFRNYGSASFFLKLANYLHDMIQ